SARAPAFPFFKSRKRQGNPKSREFLKRLLPPVVVDFIRQRPLFPRAYVWDGIYEHFRDVPTHGDYNDDRRVEELIEQAKGFLTAVKTGQQPRLWHDHLAILAAAIGSPTGGVSVLDFGGGAGTGFLQLLVTLRAGMRIQYRVVDLNKMCAA